MKKYTLISIVAALTCLVTTDTLSQSFTTFPTNCNPVEVSKETASSQAKGASGSCGFESAFFSTADIKDLINVPNSVGVRFYISMDSKTQQYTDVMAVAIDKNGTELKGSSSQRQYLLTKPLDVRFLYNAIGLNQYEAKKRISNLDNGSSKIQHFVSYLGKDGLEYLLKTSSCDGIRLYASELNRDGSTYRTMSYGAVQLSKSDVVNDLGENYLQAQHPCPIDCGGDGNYLWNGK